MYLGHDKTKSNIQYINNKITRSEFCTILKSCIENIKKVPINNKNNSYYSKLLDDVYKTNIKDKETESIFLTIVGDFISEESDRKANNNRLDKRGVYLKESLKKILDSKVVSNIRIIVLPNSGSITKIQRQNLYQTTQIFKEVFGKKLIDIRLDSLPSSLGTMGNELSNAMTIRTINAFYKKKDQDYSICKFYIKEGKGKTFTIKNLCNGNIKINDSTILENGSVPIKFDNEVILLEIPKEGVHRITISEKGVSMPLNIDLNELLPKHIAQVVLFTLMVFFTFFAYKFIVKIYQPLFVNYFNKKVLLPIIGISIEVSSFLVFWASSILIVYLYSIIQLLTYFN